MTAPPNYLTIAEASRRIASNELSPVQLVQACLDRIDAVDDQLNSFVLLLRDEALARAREAETAIMRGESRGPLHGIPIGLKDIIETAGIRTTGYSHLRLDYVPTRDATAARKLRDAGAILLGKLATHEFAVGGPSFDLPFLPARNPWNTANSPGGSSSGSAAAVAAGLCLGALGTDTGGSVRTPAAFCGLAGLKPTYGRVGRAGVFPLVYSMDNCGPLTWSVEDCALMLDAIAGHDPRDPASYARPAPNYASTLTGDIEGLRIGVVRHFYQDDEATSPETRTAIDAAVSKFADLGAIVEDIRLSPLDDYHACAVVIILSEAFAVHQKDLQTRPHDYGEFFRHRVMVGAFIGASDYVQATRLRRILRTEMNRALETYDVLLTATTSGPAPKFEDVPKFGLTENPLLTTPANVTGHPALNVCCGFSESGLPLAMQLIGRHFDEATVLMVGDAYEQATPWREHRPNL